MIRYDITEQALHDFGIKYQRRADGVIVVKGNIDLGYRNLKHLPNLSKVHVTGNFQCSHNNLTSLEGAPAFVGGNFACAYNRLFTLEGAPSSVGNKFYCAHNQLQSLQYLPKDFSELCSDFGEFASWGDIPQDLRTPATRVKKLTTLQKPVKTIRPIKAGK